MPQYATADPVGRLADLGTFFAGNLGPPLTLIFVNQHGGLLDLSPQGSSSPVIEVYVRRWDPRKLMALGAVVTAGLATVFDQTLYKGQALFDWTQSGPVASVPLETGWYVLQAVITLPNGIDQGSQRAVLQVLPSPLAQTC